MFSCWIKRKRNGIRDVLPLCCHLPGIGTQYFPLTDHLCCALIRGKALWESHQQHIPHLGIRAQCPRSGALGMVFAINTGHYFKACSASSSLPTHIDTHLHSYCMYIKLIIPVTNLCKTISGLCVEWFQIGVAGKGKRPHQYLQRISPCGALVRFRTRKTV